MHWVDPKAPADDPRHPSARTPQPPVDNSDPESPAQTPDLSTQSTGDEQPDDAPPAKPKRRRTTPKTNLADALDRLDKAKGKK